MPLAALSRSIAVWSLSRCFSSSTFSASKSLNSLVVFFYVSTRLVSPWRYLRSWMGPVLWGVTGSSCMFDECFRVIVGSISEVEKAYRSTGAISPRQPELS